MIGASGSGKSTLSRSLAAHLDVPHLELDSIYHLPGWTPLDTGEFRHRVSQFTAGDGWVVDGNYSTVRDIVWTRADTVVLLDYPRWRVMSRLVPRSLRRVVTREQLWNGNREQLAKIASRDPDRNVILWTWRGHAKHYPRFVAASQDPQWAHLTFIRLPSPVATRRFLIAVTATDLAERPDIESLLAEIRRRKDARPVGLDVTELLRWRDEDRA